MNYLNACVLCEISISQTPEMDENLAQDDREAFDYQQVPWCSYSKESPHEKIACESSPPFHNDDDDIRGVNWNVQM